MVFKPDKKLIWRYVVNPCFQYVSNALNGINYIQAPFFLNIVVNLN